MRPVFPHGQKDTEEQEELEEVEKKSQGAEFDKLPAVEMRDETV